MSAAVGPAAPRRRRWPRRLGLALLVPAVLLGLAEAGFFPWSGLDCWTDEVDLGTGRTRHARFVYWYPARVEVHDSALTAALLPADLAGRPAEWHPVNTLSPGLRHSPHYRYHGAIWQIRELELAWDLAHATAAARRESARQVLRLWREGGSDSQAGRYISALAERGHGRALDVADLPDPATAGP